MTRRPSPHNTAHFTDAKAKTIYEGRGGSRECPPGLGFQASPIAKGLHLPESPKNRYHLC
jgi:hypothetical protein